MKWGNFLLLIVLICTGVTVIGEDLPNWVHTNDGGEYLDLNSVGYEKFPNGIEAARTSRGYTVFLCDRVTKIKVKMEILPVGSYVPIRDIVNIYHPGTEYSQQILHMDIQSSEKGRACRAFPASH